MMNLRGIMLFMANMKYCMFENTYKDLLECVPEIENGTTNLSESERKYHNKLIQLCKEIAERSEEEEEEEETD